MSSIDKYVISFNEDIKGWTSFHSWNPDWMISMNKKFYTFKNGNLYRQFDPDAPRNNFYGEQHKSKLSVMVNNSPSTIKELLNVGIEGNKAWDMKIKAYVSDVDDFIASSIKADEFDIEEGIWSTYARRNEDSTQMDSASAYGIGVVTTIVGNVIIVNGFNDSLTIGDKIYNQNIEVVGVVQNHVRSGSITTITLDSVSNIAPLNYIVGSKDPRVEGGNLRGYTMRFDMEIDSASRVELFALNAEVIKSFP